MSAFTMHYDAGEDDRNNSRSSSSCFNGIADRLRLVTFCDVGWRYARLSVIVSNAEAEEIQQAVSTWHPTGLRQRTIS